MKTYIKPASQEVNIKFEGVIAASRLEIGDGTGGEHLSNHRGGWDSESWSGSDDYEE